MESYINIVMGFVYKITVQGYKPIYHIIHKGVDVYVNSLDDLREGLRDVHGGAIMSAEMATEAKSIKVQTQRGMQNIPIEQAGIYIKYLEFNNFKLVPE